MAAGLTLGDAGASNDDASYTGDVSNVPLSMDWFRQKFSQFQQAMNAADQAYQAGSVAFILTGDEGIAQLLAEYDTKAGDVRAIATTLNEGAGIVNALGGRMPELSIPQTLGALPAFVLPAAVAAAAAAVAGWYAWAHGFASGMERAITVAKDAGAGPDVVQALESEATRARQAVRLLDLSPLSTMGGWVKLAVVAGLGWLAWRSFGDVMER